MSPPQLYRLLLMHHFACHPPVVVENPISYQAWLGNAKRSFESIWISKGRLGSGYKNKRQGEFGLPSINNIIE